MKILEQRLLVRVEAHGAHRLCQIQLRAHPLQQVARLDGVLVRSLGGLHRLLIGPIDAVEIRQRELGVDHLDVAGRVDLAGDMDDVVVLEATDHVRDRVDLADVGQKLVAQALGRIRSG